MSDASLRAEGLCARHGRQRVFSDLSMQIRTGEIVALLGPNGCGKTTLIRCLTGLHSPCEGAIWLDDRSLFAHSLRQRARRIAYVPQYHRLAFGYPVLAIVLMGRMAGRGLLARPGRHDHEQAMAALEKVGAANLADRPYTQLSGGQRQLVLIARALAQDAAFLILDEPTNNLDYGNQLRLLDRLRELVSEHHGILFTTHHPEHALGTASRTILLKQGHILAEGEPEATLSHERLLTLYDLPKSTQLTVPFPSKPKNKGNAS